MIGRRPDAAFGNSTGDQQMLEYTNAGAGARLKMLVLHDDAAARIRLWPGRLPRKVGTFHRPHFTTRQEKRLDGDQHEE